MPEMQGSQENSFENDKLERKDFVLSLTRMISNAQSPFVLAIDGEWGTGKTILARMWEQHLKSEHIPVITINARETDYSENPLAPITSGITSGLGEYLDESGTERLARIIKCGKKVLRYTAPPVIELVVPVVGNILASSAEKLLSDQPKAEQSITEFKQELEETVRGLSADGSSEKTLVIFVDELDRCRPTYAVRFLEAMKHLFNVKGIVFVLAINRDQMCESIRGVYGQEFNADEYLRRLFDFHIRLPGPEYPPQAKRLHFINNLVCRSHIGNYLKRPKRLNSVTIQQITTAFVKYFGNSTLSLRDIEQAVRRLELVSLALPDTQAFDVDTSVMALLVRATDLDLYYRLVHGEFSPDEAQEELLGPLPDHCLEIATAANSLTDGERTSKFASVAYWLEFLGSVSD